MSAVAFLLLVVLIVTVGRYRIVHEDSGWVSLGQVILDAPP